MSVMVADVTFAGGSAACSTTAATGSCWCPAGRAYTRPSHTGGLVIAVAHPEIDLGGKYGQGRPAARLRDDLDDLKEAATDDWPGRRRYGGLVDGLADGERHRPRHASATKRSWHRPVASSSGRRRYCTRAALRASALTSEALPRPLLAWQRLGCVMAGRPGWGSASLLWRTSHPSPLSHPYGV